MKVLRSNLVPMQMRRLEPGIKWATYPRIEPGEYRAYCKAVRWYFDRPYRRWVCLLRFDALSPDLLQTVALLAILFERRKWRTTKSCTMGRGCFASGFGRPAGHLRAAFDPHYRCSAAESPGLWSETLKGSILTASFAKSVPGKQVFHRVI